jgi:hypothetical protein
MVLFITLRQSSSTPVGLAGVQLSLTVTPGSNQLLSRRVVVGESARGWLLVQVVTACSKVQVAGSEKG